MCGLTGILNRDGAPADLKLGNLGVVVKLNENEPGPKTRRDYAQIRDGKLLSRDQVPDKIVTDWERCVSTMVGRA